MKHNETFSMLFKTVRIWAIIILFLSVQAHAKEYDYISISKPSMNKIPVAIIGNGLSWKTVNLKLIQEIMPVYGCNALYRKFTPDKLFAIDDGIIGEIIQSSFPLDKFIVPPKDEQYEPAEYNPLRPRENTEMVSMRYAIKDGFNQLNRYGMDFLID